MGVVLLIKIFDDNRIELLDNHKRITSTLKSQTTLRQCIKNRLNIPKKELSLLMSHLLTHESILDDHPLIQGYINKPFLSTDQQEEITELVEDQVNNSYVSNYDYDVYKKKADTQDQVINLLQKQLNQVTDKLDKLERESKNQNIQSRFSNTDNSITGLQRDIISLKSENRLLLDKITRNPSLRPIPELDSISSESVPDNESINSRMIKITTRLDRIDRYLFND